jgi:hypothetical protein
MLVLGIARDARQANGAKVNVRAGRQTNPEAVMRKISSAIFVLSLAAALLGEQITPVSAQVVVNNVFSPLSNIQVSPGVRSHGRYYQVSPGARSHGHYYQVRPVVRSHAHYYGHSSSTSWINDPHHHQRCYRRWDPYHGEWQWHCARMHYGHGPYQGYGQY